MVVISKTPLRISFAGGGTDLPSFYEKNEYGAVLSTCINSFIYVTVKKHTSLFTERIRLNYSDSELVGDVEEIKNPIIRECIKFLEIDDRIYISTVADAPSQTGLGSSSTFCVGLLNALYKFKGIAVSSGRLAEEAAHIEIDILKRPMGKQDHYAAAFGGLNYFSFKADGTVTVNQPNVSKENIATLFDSMISFWTEETRPSESILKEQDKNNQKNADILIKMREQATTLYDLVRQPDFSIEDFGKIIHEGWLLKRKLASKISNSSIDGHYELALESGAIGGKISGAGGGGFLNVFTIKKNRQEVLDRLTEAGLIPYKFDFETGGTMVMTLD